MQNTLRYSEFININKMDYSKYEVVIIGGDHYNTLWTARSLGSVGIKTFVIVWAPKISKSFVCTSKYVNKYRIVHDEEDVLNILTSHECQEKRVLFSSSDQAAEFVDKNYDILSNNYYLAGCDATKGKLNHWLDKKNMLDLAKKVGLNVAYTSCVDLSKDFDMKDLSEIPYPCLIKPELSSHGSKNDYRICENSDELSTALHSLENVCNQVLIQEFLKPEYEATLTGIACDNVQIPTIVHKLRTCKDLQNLGMIVFSKLDNDVDKVISTLQVESLIEKMGYKGCFSVDLMHAKGKTYFLEVNLRTDGTMYMSTSAGVNFPLAWVDYCLFHKQSNLCLKKAIHAMTEISYVKYLDYRHPLRCMKEWFMTDCYSIFFWRDIKPFIFKFLYAIKK